MSSSYSVFSCLFLCVHVWIVVHNYRNCFHKTFFAVAPTLHAGGGHHASVNFFSRYALGKVTFIKVYMMATSGAHH